MAKNLRSFLTKKYPNAFSTEILSEIEWLNTGLPTLNYVLSGKPFSGGMPLSGKITCIYGPEGCMSASTFIQYSLFDTETGKCFNHKGGTIEHLYERFHNLSVDGRCNKIKRETTAFYVNSIDEKTNLVIRQPIVDVVKTGTKECYELTTKSGKKVVATSEHNFYVGNEKYVMLSDLNVGDTVYIHENISLIVIEDTVESIIPVGLKETYDIKCFAPNNNYIADGIVVHNSGKTSFINHMIHQAQVAGIEVVYLDTERSITKPRLEQFQVNVDDLIYSTPESAEECFSIIEDIYKERVANGQEKEPILIMWDSLAGTPTQDELERTAFQVEIASQPKVFSRNLRRIRGKIQRMNASLLLVNQARANQDKYGDLFTMPGGYALYHNCDIILRVNKMKPDEIGMGIKMSTPSKNRHFKPFQNTIIQFDYIKGFTEENIMDAFCEFLKNITILGQAGAYCYLSTDVAKIMEAEGVDEKEATKLVKKFYKKDFVERLMNDKEYYEQILKDSEEYVNNNITRVAKLMLDDEIDLTNEDVDEVGIKVSKKKLTKYINEEDLED